MDSLTIIPFEGFPEDQYYKQEFPKTQLTIHYSASGNNPIAMFKSWMGDNYRVATCDGLAHDGTVHRCFDPKYFAAHIGYYLNGNEGTLAKFPNTNNQAFNISIERRTIGIEVLNWGRLTFKDGKYYSWANAEVKKDRVITYDTPWRGDTHFEKFTEQQICALDLWIRKMCTDFNIPMKFSGNFDIDEKAIMGEPGITMHTNFRADKQDMHPQPELIEMFNQFK